MERRFLPEYALGLALALILLIALVIAWRGGT